MELIPEWAPNIHPMLVHFPIAILLLAVFMDLVNFFVPDDWWDDTKTTLLYGVGVISAIAAYYTGTWAADTVFLPSQAQNVLNSHSDWAVWTVWYFIGYVVLRFGLHWFKMLDRKIINVAAFIIALPGVFLLYETGEHGAELVFGYGAGTGQLLQQEEVNVPSDSQSIESNTTFKVMDNDNWTWTIGPNGVSTLLSHFRWLEGSVQDLKPEVLQNEKNYLLKLTVDSITNFFVEERTIQNVQVDYYLDFSGFQGKVSLVNHVQNSQNYDFVALSSDGTITQGRVINGERKVLAEEQYTASGMMFIRTVASDTHFRAYINEEMAIHSHGEAPEAGSIGLKLNGTGTILIDSISLTQLN